MWGLRSYLRRRSPLITSRLRSVHRHDATHTAGHGRNLIAASRRRFSDATHQPVAAAMKPDLYLVLDDHKKDYGIYKLDVDDLLDGDAGSDTTTAPRRLPRPALIRLEVTDEEPSAQFATAGGCIVATGRSPYQGLAESDDHGIVTMLYDIKTAALSVSLHPTVTLQYGYKLAVAVGNRLYVFDSYTNSDDSFHCMTTARDGDDAADGEVKQREWGWWYNSGSSRIAWSDSCELSDSPEELPFDPDEIQAHAVHPRDGTIFVSAPVGYELPFGGWRYGVDTFAFYTTGDSFKWTRYGRWALPFNGHAHYDRQLNMWVGLYGDDKEEGTYRYISACHVPSSEHDDYFPETEWTSSMEKILLDDLDRRRIDFKLVYMAERGEYCLVERLRLQGAAEKGRLSDGEDCVLRLTTFRLKYEYDEPDNIGIIDRRARSYKVSRYRKDFEAQAFWI